MQAHQLAEMQRSLEKWSNQARFIQMIIDGQLVVSKKKKLDLIAELKQKGFKAFAKVTDATKQGEAEPTVEKEESDDDTTTGANSYDYLLGVSDTCCISLDDTNDKTDAYLVPDQGAC